MAYDYEVTVIREKLESIEGIVDCVKDALTSADLPMDLWEDLEAVDDLITDIRVEVDDVEGYTECDPSDVRHILQQISELADDGMREL